MGKLQGHNPLKQSHVTLLKQIITKTKQKLKINIYVIGIYKKKLNTKYYNWKINLIQLK